MMIKPVIKPRAALVSPMATCLSHDYAFITGVSIDRMTVLAWFWWGHLNLEWSSPPQPGLVDRAPCWRVWGPGSQGKQEGLSQELGDQEVRTETHAGKEPTGCR